MAVFTDAKIIDVKSGDILDDGALVIEEGVVAWVGPKAELSADTSDAVSLGGGYVIPGLISSHVHFDLGFGIPHGESLPARTLRAAENARKTLRSGVTTVRLAGTEDGLDFALRGSIQKGETTGPRIYTAGNGICSTGGHGAGSFIEADGADEFRRAARSQVSLGADLIKIVPSGGVAGTYEKAGDTHLTAEEMAAAAQVAHAWGKHITAHLGGADTIRLAIECGVDCVEHGYQLDAETAEFMAERGTYLSPTIGVTRAEEFYLRMGESEAFLQKILGPAQRHWDGLVAAIKAGVKIITGTDLYPHEPIGGTTAHIREMEYYQDAGLSPLQALQAATVNPATLLGDADRIGSLEVGAFGDFLVLDENPLESISALRSIREVVLGGKVIDRENPRD